LERNWVQSHVDLCLFMKSGMTCVVYVDDTIIGVQQMSDINWEIVSLGLVDNNMQHTFTLRDEREVSTFLGIEIKRLSSNKFQFSQPVLTMMHLENYCGWDTPAATSLLYVDWDRPAFDLSWQYDSVIGMMMYVSNNAHLDIAYAVHQAARLIHYHCQSHAVGIKRIAQYLKQT
jgi:hypothetical protein